MCYTSSPLERSRFANSELLTTINSESVRISPKHLSVKSPWKVRENSVKSAWITRENRPKTRSIIVCHFWLFSRTDFLRKKWLCILKERLKLWSLGCFRYGQRHTESQRTGRESKSCCLETSACSSVCNTAPWPFLLQTFTLLCS